MTSVFRPRIFSQSTFTARAMATKQRNVVGLNAIFFDLDNTLIATRKADKLTCNKLTEVLYERFSIPMDASRVICSSYLRAFRKCPDNPKMDLDTWRHLLWAQALGDEYSAYAGDVYLKWLQLRYHYLALTPDIMTLLNKLHQHYLLGLITNGPSSAQWEKIEKLKLRSHFDIILVSGDLPWEKPQHEIFHEACEFLGVEPRQCLMVGDKLETDILGGIQANLGATVWVPLSNADDGGAFNPDYTIEKVTDLPSILPKNPRMPAFRRRKSVASKFVRSQPDLDDYSSNGSDGS